MSISSVAGFDNFCKPEVITGTGEILEDKSASGRIRPWGERKVENQKLVELLDIARKFDSSVVSDSRLVSIAECASWAKFAEMSDSSRKLFDARFCRFRLCPMCCWRKSLKLFAQVSAVTDAILADKKVRFIFVTLTVKNVVGSELRDTIKAMNEGFKRLTSKGKGAVVASAGLRKNLLGYMKAIEVTCNIDRNDFHPHIHCIFEVRPSYFDGSGGGYLTHSDWRQMWQDVMRLDYEPQVNVKAIKADERKKAVSELAKYSVKMNDLLEIRDKNKAAKVLVELSNAIKNCRFVTFGGDFKEYKRKLSLDDVEKGDLVHVETGIKELNAVAYVLFTFRAKFGAYIC